MKKISAVRSNRLFDLVDPKHFDLVLLVHCFVTGLIDASTFNNWNVFVGGQTGNTVILALSTAGLPMGQPYSWLTTLVSIASYLLGGFITARLSWYCVPLCRITITANLLFQGILILVSAAMITAGKPFIPVDDITNHIFDTLGDPRIVTVIPLLAFQGGAQIVTSKLLGFDELPVNVVTNTYASLTADQDLFRKSNIKRDRRIASILCLFAGAVCAAWIMKTGQGIVLSLWLSAFIKILVALCVGIFAPERKGEV